MPTLSEIFAANQAAQSQGTPQDWTAGPGWGSRLTGGLLGLLDTVPVLRAVVGNVYGGATAPDRAFAMQEQAKRQRQAMQNLAGALGQESPAAKAAVGAGWAPEEVGKLYQGDAGRRADSLLKQLDAQARQLEVMAKLAEQERQKALRDKLAAGVPGLTPGQNAAVGLDPEEGVKAMIRSQFPNATEQTQALMLQLLMQQMGKAGGAPAAGGIKKPAVPASGSLE